MILIISGDISVQRGNVVLGGALGVVHPDPPTATLIPRDEDLMGENVFCHILSSIRATAMTFE